MERSIIRINEEKCNGCGLCIPNCPEGALQILDGKARLVSDLFCDGLGACSGRCPQEAIIVEKWEAAPYDERVVMEENIIPKGKTTILAHLNHLKEHGAFEYLQIALLVIKSSSLAERVLILDEFQQGKEQDSGCQTGCPGSRERTMIREASTENQPSALTHWPIQLHLINPESNIFNGADLLVAADCTAFSLGGFHNQLLQNKKVIIACPKLDQGQEIYREKLIALINTARINTITIAIMEVPCCGGLVYLVKQALEKAARKVPVKQIILSTSGMILEESWL